MRWGMTGEPYAVYGYGGKQVRDNIHGHRGGETSLLSAVPERERAGSETGW